MKRNVVQRARHILATAGLLWSPGDITEGSLGHMYGVIPAMEVGAVLGTVKVTIHQLRVVAIR